MVPDGDDAACAVHRPSAHDAHLRRVWQRCRRGHSSAAGDSLVNGTNLAINVLTLLFLPILQATQNRDGAALQAKLDELIKANQGARNDFIGLEQRDEEEIEELRQGPENVTDPHPETEPAC